MSGHARYVITSSPVVNSFLCDLSVPCRPGYNASAMPPICHSDFHEPNAPPGPGWYPAAIEGDTVLWQYLGDAEFSKPFFQDTLYQHR